jgi:hypothetical protein
MDSGNRTQSLDAERTIKALAIAEEWSDITQNSAHFEQSYSDDGGKTWEANWITDQTRTSDSPDKPR